MGSTGLLRSNIVRMATKMMRLDSRKKSSSVSSTMALSSTSGDSSIAERTERSAGTSEGIVLMDARAAGDGVASYTISSKCPPKVFSSTARCNFES